MEKTEKTEKTEEWLSGLQVSESTRRNWRKLRTSAENRLTRRANKQLSQRNIMPLEYFRNRKNTGVVRRFVQRFSEGDFQLEDALFTAGVLLLKQRGISERENVRRVLAEYPLSFLPELAAESLPDGEFDLLGLLYQSLLTEGNKNRKGSYYTPERTVRKILRGIRISSGMRFLDPCCGSGAFLLSVKCEDPRSLCGRDSDPVAVMLSKFNMLLKYAEFDFIPDIRCEDYLLSSSGELFDCVATNPPWGAADTGGYRTDAVSSGESFSLFFVKSFRALKPGGNIRFLLPRSVLNIRKHRDLRQFLLKESRIDRIESLADRFSGVSTESIILSCRALPPGRTFLLDGNRVCTAFVQKNIHAVFSVFSPEAAAVWARVEKRKKYTLAGSLWALGIVTGNNREKLSSVPVDGLEPIYTGREIEPYGLKPCKNYICYDRNALQQTAPDEYYRAPEKLVYRFISDELIFALDASGSLFLNSANILIPRIPGMSIRTVLGFLNSELFRYLWHLISSDVKVLKENLLQLPFPELTPEEDQRIEDLVTRILRGESAVRMILEDEIFSFFSLSSDQILLIRRELFPEKL